jgi:hypothetical protein
LLVGYIRAAFMKCPIWDDVRTYLTSPENRKEITKLKVAINYLKEKEKSSA